MPLFEYKCLACGELFEMLVLKTSQSIVCPSRSADSIERLISMFAVSSESSRQASTAAAYKYNNKLNAKQEPDKQRIQIEHKHQH
jgi:putative FmdB family regulatory protein